MMSEILTVVVLLIQTANIAGHGRLVVPPSRASMWRYGFDFVSNRDYNDNQGFCGGKERQIRNGGRCGICGDPWDVDEKPHEAGGIYATGIIVMSYRMGQSISVEVELTANHLGYSEFRLCVNNDVTKTATQECFDENVLQLTDGSGTRYHLDNTVRRKRIHLKLPAGVACTQCILQWKYHVGNSWGVDPDGTACNGCGPQEEFYACSDISISGESIDSGVTVPHSITNQVTTEITDTTNQITDVTTQITDTITTEITDTTTQVTDTTNQITDTTNQITDATTQITDTTTVTLTVVQTIGSTYNHDCRAIGVFKDNASYDAWCSNNCALGNCPPYLCSCGGDTDTHAALGCVSRGVYKNTVNDIWCKTNCQLGYCPSSHCICNK